MIKTLFRKMTGTQMTAEAEEALAKWRIPYKRQANGRLYVEGDLNISCRNLTVLPDLTCVEVGGDFDCSVNRLTSLIGAPAFIRGDFRCNNNALKSLGGAPSHVGGVFTCCNNPLTSLKGAPDCINGSFECTECLLTSLEGAPSVIAGDFNCDQNQLTSLEGAPAVVKGFFLCTGNRLTSLIGAPDTVGGDFYCEKNPLTSLAGMPQKCGKIISDLGHFEFPDQIPAHLKIPPQQKEAEEQREKVLSDALSAVRSGAKKPVRILRPARVKKPPAARAY